MSYSSAAVAEICGRGHILPLLHARQLPLSSPDVGYVLRHAVGKKTVDGHLAESETVAGCEDVVRRTAVGIFADSYDARSEIATERVVVVCPARSGKEAAGTRG